MKKILIIEDEKSLGQAYQQKLGEIYDLTIVTTGTEGLAKAQEIAPDLIVLDIVLPGGKDGFQVLEQLKQHPKVKDVPVIVATNLDEEHRQKAMALGAIDYVVKTNMQLDDLISLIKKYADIN